MRLQTAFPEGQKEALSQGSAPPNQKVPSPGCVDPGHNDPGLFLIPSFELGLPLTFIAFLTNPEPIPEDDFDQSWGT